MKKIIILSIIVILLISCVSLRQQQLNTWLGVHKSELIRSWGPPNRTASDGKDGEILIYEKTATRTFYNYFGQLITQTITNYTDMFVNNNGIIYAYSYGTR